MGKNKDPAYMLISGTRHCRVGRFLTFFKRISVIVKWRSCVYLAKVRKKVKKNLLSNDLHRRAPDLFWIMHFIEPTKIFTVGNYEVIKRFM
jgi:hypothetical protein